MKSVEATGRSVDEAVAQALEELGAKRDDVEVEVLEEGSKGLFGLLGAKQARVRVTLLHSIDSKVEAGKAFLSRLLSYMGVEATIDSKIGDDNLAHLTMSGRRMGVIIGRRGQTLDAIQYLVNLVANRGDGPRARIVLDAEGYREKRAETLKKLAERLAERVLQEGRKAVLEPMSALERRVVHLALAEDDRVETRSEGEEPYRRVVIVPRRA